MMLVEGRDDISIPAIASTMTVEGESDGILIPATIIEMRCNESRLSTPKTTTTIKAEAFSLITITRTQVKPKSTNFFATNLN